MPRRPTVLASQAASVVMYALARGISMEAISAASGLTREDLIDPDARVGDESLAAVLDLIAASAPDEAIGLHMAQAAPFTMYGALAHAARFAEDLRGALLVFVRYRSVLSESLHLELVEGEGESALEMSHPNDSPTSGHGPELAFGMGARFIREIVHVDAAIVRVEFSHRRRGPLERYVEHFGAEVLFERPVNRIVFADGGLARPTAAADPTLHRFIQEHLEAASRRLAEAGEEPEIARIREAIAANAERSEYGIEALARRLAMSVRSLQRLAQAHGTSVRELIDRTREANARVLLGDRSLSLDDVAFLLGYSNESALRRAFKRWTGETPAAFRRAG
ncbi:MAG: AraC family transcriptional regulator [Myxococcales bacterium]|nr:AraC family transcriptional regulator [Myxococcales bacterium]